MKFIHILHLNYLCLQKVRFFKPDCLLKTVRLEEMITMKLSFEIWCQLKLFLRDKKKYTENHFI